MARLAISISILLAFYAAGIYAQSAPQPNTSTSVAPFTSENGLVNCCYNYYTWQGSTQGTCPANSFEIYSWQPGGTSQIWYNCLTVWATCQYVTQDTCTYIIANQANQGSNPNKFGSTPK